MLVSTSDGDLGHFKPCNLKSIEELQELILKTNYSFGYFLNNERKKERFVTASAIGLDFDNGLSLEEAKQIFGKYRHIISTTKSHMKEKNGVIAERFRVILFLSSPIKDARDFEATWHEVAKLAPAADKACKDASRFFYPSTSIISASTDGLLITPVKYVEPEKPKLTLVTGELGKLGVNTLRFLAEGASGGDWNNSLHKAARDMHQQGYTLEQAIEKFSNMVNPHYSGKLDSKDLSTIKSAYNKEPAHPPRVPDRTFNFQPIGESYKTKHTKEWVVERLLQVGGMSVIVAEPKAGKSTIARQIVRSVLRGEPVLGRQVKKGNVFWLALEEAQEDVNEGFKKLGIRDDEALSVHIGSAVGTKVIEDLRETLLQTKPTLIVIDTLFDLLQVESERNYNEVRNHMAKLSEICRETNSHILCIHHANKQAKDDSRRGLRAVLGSQAISAKCDVVMVMECDEDRRTLFTRGRGIMPWLHREIIFDAKSQTYTIGPESNQEKF